MKAFYIFLLIVFGASAAFAQDNLPFTENFNSPTFQSQITLEGTWAKVTTQPVSPESGGGYLTENSGRDNISFIRIAINATETKEIKVSWYERKTGNNKTVARAFSYKIGNNTFSSPVVETVVSDTWVENIVTLDNADNSGSIILQWEITTKPGNAKYAFDDVKVSGKSIKFSPATVYLGGKLGEPVFDYYYISGQKLTSKVTITAPEPFLISRDGYSFADTIELIPSASGSIDRIVHVQYKGSATPATYKEIITHTSDGISNNLAVEGYTSNIPLGVAPVELASFQAQTLDGTTQLIWTTATETENEKFVVERSMDGKIFSPIGQVKGNGNSATKQSYSFTDINPLDGANYYRLRQIDYDGAYAFSNVVALQRAEGVMAATVYPTTTNNEVTISLQNATGNTTISVVDATGRPVATFANTTAREIKLPVHNLRSGLYFVRVTNGQSQQVQRFIKE